VVGMWERHGGESGSSTRDTGGTRGARLHDCAASKTSRAISSTFRSSFITESLPLRTATKGLPKRKLKIYYLFRLSTPPPAARPRSPGLLTVINLGLLQY
jgi:hypothetical protein